MRKLLYIFTLALAFASCKKKFMTLDSVQGSYQGTFTAVSGGQPIKSDAKIVFDKQNYASLKGRGNGTFSFGDNGGNPTINFSDKNIWTADFDWNLILNGSFEYKTKGDSLILTRVLPYNKIQSFYQYRLKRIR